MKYTISLKEKIELYQISKLIEILQEVSNLEDYKKMLEEIIENYEKKYSHIQVSCHQLEFDY